MKKLRLPYIAFLVALASLVFAAPLQAMAIQAPESGPALTVLDHHKPGHDNGKGKGRDKDRNREGERLELDVRGTLRNGGTLEGTISDLAFSYENGLLMLSGVLNGTATVGGRETEIEGQHFKVPARLSQTGPTAQASGEASDDEVLAIFDPAAFSAQQQQQRCDVLFLFLGPIYLNLLGLEVILTPLVLDINAIPGPGNLLGNLLCALAGLLDPGAGLNLSGILQGVLNSLIAALNDLLGRLR